MFRPFNFPRSGKINENKDGRKERGVSVTTSLRSGGGVKSKGVVDRLRNNSGKHQDIMNRLSAMSHSEQPISNDVRSKMDTTPKYSEYVDSYYNGLKGFSSGRKDVGNGFHDVAYSAQVSRLVNIARMDEVNEILQKMATEVITPYDDSPRFCSFRIDRMGLEKADIKKEYIDKIEEIAEDFMPRLYRDLGMNGNGGYNQFIDALVKGKKTYELVYDDPDNPTKIIKVVEVDSDCIHGFVHEGKQYWRFEPRHQDGANPFGIKRKTNQQSRILHHYQIVQIDWSANNTLGHISYVHGLMKSANNLRVMEETMIIWYVTNSTFRTIHKVPTQHLNGAFSAQAVSEEKEQYTTNIDYNSATGELFIDDSTNIPFERQMFLADGDFGEPKLETLNNRSTPIDKIETNMYFREKLYRASGMPQSRFDKQGGDWSIDPTRAQREEVYFNGVVDRIKKWYGVLFLTPLYEHIAMEIPELNADVTIFENIRLEFHSINQFKELLDLAVLNEKAGYVEKLGKSFTYSTPDGNEVAFLPPNYLLERYMGITAEDFELIAEKRDEWLEMSLQEAQKKKEIMTKYGVDPEESGGGGGGRRR